MIKKVFKFLINTLKNRTFLQFVIIAAVLWYVNKLGYDYKTEVEIPIELMFDYNSLGWIENPEMKVKCLVEGNGRELIKYDLGTVATVSIPSSSLSLISTYKEGYYTITDASLREALRIAQTKISILQLLDTLPWVKISPMENITIPINNNVEVTCEKQFMVVGQPKLQPASINVLAPKSIVDTLKFIQTESLRYNDQNRSINVGVNLIIPHGVLAAEKKIRYMVDITGYTELEYNLHVGIVNMPDNMSMVCVPTIITALVKVPLRSFASERIISPEASIDYSARDRQRTNLFKIHVTNLPPGGEVTSIKPEYVEPFFIAN